MAQIITPPIRTSLMTQNGVPFSTENGDIQTTRDWWLYWNRLGDQANLSALQASQGLHSDRPVPDNMPDGAIYVESDRGVVYQLQGGDWVYVAGTMYGTISPDQRPTDLGPNDGGFAFTATDPLASDTGRTFAWSGTAWVETSQVLYGTHANRPLPAAAPARCLYAEADRGPLYQNQLGQWVYIAGTMWGTISPDQRPTDLGMFDAGFDFRTNVAPAREFLWSGTAWVEITALVDPTTTAGDLIARGATAPATRLPVGANGQVLTADSTQALGIRWAAPPAPLLASASASILLTTSPQNIPGATLTLSRAGTYLVIGVFYFTLGTLDNGATLVGQFSGSGAAVAVLTAQTTGSTTLTLGGTVSQQWLFTASAGAVVTLQAYKTSGTGNSSITSGHTSIMALWVSP